MFRFLLNRSPSKVSVVNQISHLFFWNSKIFFALFNFLKMVILTTLFRRWSTLWNSTLKITALFWRCLTLLILTLKYTYTTLFQGWFDIFQRRDVISPRPRWKSSWVSTNVAKRLHSFVKFIKLKTYIFSRIILNCCFCKLSKRYW